DRHRGRVVDEVLVAAQPALRVLRQRSNRLVLRAHRTGNRHVAGRERDADRDADADARVEDREQDAYGQHEEKAATSAPAAAVAVVEPGPGAALLHARSHFGLSANLR